MPNLLLRCMCVHVQLAVTGRAWQKLNSDPDRHAELLSMALEVSL
jgi:hypothetical protein